jgi:hypothetical protein
VPREALEEKAPREPVQLIWLDAASVPCVRRTPSFSEILAALDARVLRARELDQDLDVADREDRRDVLEILVEGKPQKPVELNHALAAAASNHGQLVHPLVLVEGELGVAFDPRKRLEAMVSAAAVHAGTEPVKGELATARAFLLARGVGHGPIACGALYDRIRTAVLSHRDKSASDDLDAEVERGLLDARAYKRRKVFGAPHVWANLAFGGAAGETIAVYLPEPLAERLPRAAKVQIKMVAAVHPGIEASEQLQASQALREAPLALWPVAAAVVAGAR